MLAPDSRRTAFELIRAPVGYRLDFAVLTTYTLDLEALLALPLSVVAHPDGGLEELLAEPLRLHQAVREAGDRVHAFVDEKGIAIPGRARPLYAMLESSVHAVRAPSGGAFHPKVWVARFTAVDAEAPSPNAEPADTRGAADDLLRVAVLSRNLTFDRSWDVALASEAPLRSRRRVAASRPLGEFLRELPALASLPLPEDVAERVQALADQVVRCAFPAPEGFDSPVTFHALGLSSRRRAWKPPSSGYRALAMAPFVNRTGLDAVRALSGDDRMLVSRQEELDKLSAGALAGWDTVLVLADAAQGEAEDAAPDRDDGLQGSPAGDDVRTPGPARLDDSPEAGAGALPSGLHAKVVAIEHGHNVTWYVGSANLTAAALGGRNVEMMASVTGRKGRKGGATGHGIDRFLDGGPQDRAGVARQPRRHAAGFRQLCVPYERTAAAAEDPHVTAARERLEAVRDALVDADLRVTCTAGGDLWILAVEGGAALPEGDVKVVTWPVSVAEGDARPLDGSPSWKLSVPRLTAFIAFRLHVPVPGVDDVRLTLRLPAAGMPGDRIHQILRSLLDSPEKFLRFLRALLGGLDAVLAWTGDADADEAPVWGIGVGGETLLDDLVRAASRDPGRLEPVRRLIDDLSGAEADDGRRIVPDVLLDIWNAVEEALAREKRA